MPDQIDKKPCFQQDHKNNEFKCTGDKELSSVCGYIHRNYNYPSRNEHSEYLSISPKGQPVYIRQDYDEPVGNRPADMIQFFKFKSEGDDYDTELFRAFCSDVLFGGKAACVMSKSRAALNSLVIFADILKEEPRLASISYVIKIGEKAKNKITPECKKLLPESLLRMIKIFSSMANSTENIKTAIKIATTEIGSSECKTSAADRTVKARDTQPTNEYKLSEINEHMKNKNVSENAGTERYHIASASVDKKPDTHISAQGSRSADGHISSLTLVRKQEKNAPECKTVGEAALSMDLSQQPMSFSQKCELLYSCSISDNPKHKEYVTDFLKKIRSDADFRRETTEKIWNMRADSEHIRELCNTSFHGYAQELALLAGDIEQCGDYVHELFYMGLINGKVYRSFSSTDRLTQLCIIAADEFAGCETNHVKYARLTRFLNGLTGTSGRKIKKMLKEQIVRSLDKSINESRKALKLSKQNKIEALKRMKQIF